MADEPNPTPVAGDPPVDPAGGEPAATPTPEELAASVERLQKALNSERQLKAAAEKKLNARDEAEKSEVQKATDRATAAEQRIAELEKSVMRAKVAAELQLPAAIADRLKGDDEAEMLADGKTLLKEIRPNGNLGGRAGGLGSPGGGGAPAPDDMSARIRAAAGR